MLFLLIGVRDSPNTNAKHERNRFRLPAVLCPFLADSFLHIAPPFSFPAVLLRINLPVQLLLLGFNSYRFAHLPSFARDHPTCCRCCSCGLISFSSFTPPFLIVPWIVPFFIPSSRLKLDPHNKPNHRPNADESSTIYNSILLFTIIYSSKSTKTPFLPSPQSNCMSTGNRFLASSPPTLDLQNQPAWRTVIVKRHHVDRIVHFYATTGPFCQPQNYHWLGYSSIHPHQRTTTHRIMSLRGKFYAEFGDLSSLYRWSFVGTILSLTRSG